MPSKYFHAPSSPPSPVAKTRASTIWGIITDIPHMKLIVAVVIFGVVLIGLFRTLLLGEAQPLLLPMLAAVISGLTILIIDFRQRFSTTYMRLGFHGGMLVFLTAVPMLAPEMIGKADEQVRFTAGVTIVLCVVGFELAYWFMRTLGGPPRPQPVFYLLAGNYAWANRLLFLGLLSFGIFLAYAVASSGRSLWTMLFTLRASVEVDMNEVLFVPDDTTNKIALVFSYGRYMAAAAASILLLAPNPYHFPINRPLCWFALFACMFYGLNAGSGGSRGVFMLSSVPLLATLWMYFGRSAVLRQLRPALVALLLFVVYFGFQYLSAFRDQGVIHDSVEVKYDKVDLTDPRLITAFSIYKDYEVIIAGFPDKVDFQNGRSLVPIALGWVPRSLWPSKPFPFTSVANKIMGLRQEEVTIAASLPGEGYGNFGVAGGFLWGMAMGLACGFADFRLSNIRPGHPLALGLRGIMAVWAALLVRGGTAEMFYMGVFPVAFMWVCLIFSKPRYIVAQ
jgi:hypothetical protein